MRIIAFITDASVVRDILTHLGEPTSQPRLMPARGPPLWDSVNAGVAQEGSHGQQAPAHEFDQSIAWQLLLTVDVPMRGATYPAIRATTGTHPGEVLVSRQRFATPKFTIDHG